MVDQKQKKRTKNIFKLIPWYGYIAGALIFFINWSAYEGAKAIISIWSESWKVVPAIPGIDTNIPFVPYFFAQVYILWYPLVIFAPMLLSAFVKKEHFINIVLAWIAGEIIAFFIFFLAPSYMDRTNVAGVIAGGYGNLIDKIEHGSGFSYWLMKMVMWADGGHDNYNLFPSLHCYMIVFCYLAVMNRKEVHIGYRIFWLVMAIAICFSTVFTKQHYIVDMFLGILIAFIMYFVFTITNPAKHILEKCPNFLIIEKLNWTHEKITRRTIKSK